MMIRNHPTKCFKGFLKTVFLSVVFVVLSLNASFLYSKESSMKREFHKNISVRKKIASITKKSFSSEKPENNFNEGVKQMVDKLSYCFDSDNRIGFIVKNKTQVGLTIKF